MAYTGRFAVQGDRLTTTADISWDKSWLHIPQVRTIELNGERWNFGPTGRQDPRSLKLLVVEFYSGKRRVKRLPNLSIEPASEPCLRLPLMSNVSDRLL